MTTATTALTSPDVTKNKKKVTAIAATEEIKSLEEIFASEKVSFGSFQKKLNIYTSTSFQKTKLDERSINYNEIGNQADLAPSEMEDEYELMEKQHVVKIQQAPISREAQRKLDLEIKNADLHMDNVMKQKVLDR